VATELDDQCPDSCQRHPDPFLPGDSLSQEQPGQDGNLDEHSAVDDAGLHHGEGMLTRMPSHWSVVGRSASKTMPINATTTVVKFRSKLTVTDGR